MSDMPPVIGGERPGPLELTDTQVRAMLAAATDRIAAYVASLPHRPAAEHADAEAAARAAIEPIPTRAVGFDALLDSLFERLLPAGLETAGPGYLAYVPGGGLIHAAIADLLAAAVNRYVGVWFAAPGLVALEATVIRWFCDIVGYPGNARGFLTTGGSLANLGAIVTARRERLPDDGRPGELYASDQVHHSVTKAAVIAGLPASYVREVPTDASGRMRPDLLERAIAVDRAAGGRPFLVVGNAGTTNTGAVDDLERIGQIAAREELWFHVDAAYGGFFLLTERGRARMAGTGRG